MLPDNSPEKSEEDLLRSLDATVQNIRSLFRLKDSLTEETVRLKNEKEVWEREFATKKEQFEKEMDTLRETLTKELTRDNAQWREMVKRNHETEMDRVKEQLKDLAQKNAMLEAELCEVKEENQTVELSRAKVL